LIIFFIQGIIDWTLQTLEMVGVSLIFIMI